MTITLKELIDNLKKDLLEAQMSEGEPMFTLEETTIKTRIIAVDKTQEGGGVKFFVANASIGAAQENTSEHEITIKLKPIPVIVLGES